jgi:hypothetical protein
MGSNCQVGLVSSYLLLWLKCLFGDSESINDDTYDV